jgi:hypothetical protein
MYSTWTSQTGLKTQKQCSITNNLQDLHINSFKKPISMIDQLHKCEYYNRIKIIFLSYSSPPITSNISPHYRTDLD